MVFNIKLDSPASVDRTIEKNYDVIGINDTIIATEDAATSQCLRIRNPRAVISCLNCVKEAGQKAQREICQMNADGVALEKIRAKAKERIAVLKEIPKYHLGARDLNGRSYFGSNAQAIANAKPSTSLSTAREKPSSCVSGSNANPASPTKPKSEEDRVRDRVIGKLNKELKSLMQMPSPFSDLS